MVRYSSMINNTYTVSFLHGTNQPLISKEDLKVRELEIEEEEEEVDDEG